MKSYVWSAGSDGLIKEWNMTGEKRECLRQVAPPGSEKGEELRKNEKTCYLLHVFFNVMLLSLNSHTYLRTGLYQRMMQGFRCSHKAVDEQ